MKVTTFKPYSALASFLIALPSQAAMTLFDGTGLDLFNDPKASFPTRTPSVDGTSLTFGAGTDSREKLVSFSLFPAGAFEPLSDPIVFTIQLNLTRVTSDTDLGLHVTDGSDAAGILIADNGDGTAQTQSGQNFANTIGFSGGDELFSGAGFPAVGESLNIETTISASISGSNVSVSVNGSTGSRGARFLRPEQALSFVLLAGTDSEEYRFNSLRITSSVPEPSSTALLVLGLSIGLGRRRRA